MPVAVERERTGRVLKIGGVGRHIANLSWSVGMVLAGIGYFFTPIGMAGQIERQHQPFCP